MGRGGGPAPRGRQGVAGVGCGQPGEGRTAGRPEAVLHGSAGARPNPENPENLENPPGQKEYLHKLHFWASMYAWNLADEEDASRAGAELTMTASVGAARDREPMDREPMDRVFRAARAMEEPGPKRGKTGTGGAGQDRGGAPGGGPEVQTGAGPAGRGPGHPGPRAPTPRERAGAAGERGADPAQGVRGQGPVLDPAVCLAGGRGAGRGPGRRAAGAHGRGGAGAAAPGT